MRRRPSGTWHPSPDTFGHAILAVSLLLAAACASTTEAPPPDRLRVLFLGNSLTFTNDVPGIVHRLGAADGITIETRDESQPNYALEDHWNRPASRSALGDGPWDVVVLQQGPSSLPASRTELVRWSRTWADAIRARGARPALYTVWPDRSRLAYLDDVITSYRVASDSARAALYPAGAAWRAAWSHDATLPLYGPDDFHPSAMGSYVAALTIYRGLTGRMPPAVSGFGIDARTDSLLRAAVAEVTGR